MCNAEKLLQRGNQMRGYKLWLFLNLNLKHDILVGFLPVVFAVIFVVIHMKTRNIILTMQIVKMKMIDVVWSAMMK
jgi:hypothetical protein